MTCADFNPHAPCGARRRHTLPDAGALRISIHVPRVGHDAPPCHLADRCTYFNPRATCGARPGRRGHRGRLDISIHVPREEHDYFDGDTILGINKFQSSRTVRGHDRLFTKSTLSAALFQSTCPVGRRDPRQVCLPLRRCYFNPHAAMGTTHRFG